MTLADRLNSRGIRFSLHRGGVTLTPPTTRGLAFLAKLKAHLSDNKVLVENGTGTERACWRESARAWFEE